MECSIRIVEKIQKEFLGKNVFLSNIKNSRQSANIVKMVEEFFYYY